MSVVLLFMSCYYLGLNLPSLSCKPTSWTTATPY